MKVISVRKTEGLECKLCKQPIENGEEAVCFYHKGTYHFVHLLCQFNRHKRKVSFEEFVKDLKFRTTQHHNKQKLKAKTVEESAKLYQKRMKRFTPEGHTPLWYYYQ